MKYLHTMVRISDVDNSLDFYCNKLGMQEVYRYDSEAGRFTNIFLSAPDDLANTEGKRSTERAPVLELTYNWDKEDYKGGRNFGHLAFAVDDIHAACAALMKAGVTIRACSHHVNSQPTALKKFRHSIGVNIWQTSPIAFQTSSKVLAPAFLR